MLLPKLTRALPTPPATADRRGRRGARCLGVLLGCVTAGAGCFDASDPIALDDSGGTDNPANTESADGTQTSASGTSADAGTTGAGSTGNSTSEGGGSSTSSSSGASTGSGGDCEAPRQTCGGACVDVQTDRDHCGACDRECLVPCADGECAYGAIITDAREPVAVVLHAGHLYFTNTGINGTGTIQRFALDEPGRVETVAGGIWAPRYFTFGGDQLYYYDDDTPDAILWRAPAAGPPSQSERLVRDLSAFGSGTNYPYGLAATAEHVFYMDTRRLFRRRSADQTDEVDPGVSFGAGLMVDDTRLYYVHVGTVYSMDVDFPGFPSVPDPVVLTVLPEGYQFVRARAQDATHLYWATTGSGNRGIVRVAKDGSTATVVVDNPDPLGLDADIDVRGLAVDSEHVYHSVRRLEGRVYRTPIAGGETVKIADADDPTGIAVGDTHVYWAEETAGLIMRLAKSGL